MAQTTRLTSFGPVFVVSAQSITYLVIRAYIHSRTFISIEKKRRKMKKNSPMAQTARLALFGPVLVVANLSASYSLPTWGWGLVVHCRVLVKRPTDSRL